MRKSPFSLESSVAFRELLSGYTPSQLTGRMVLHTLHVATGMDEGFIAHMQGRKRLDGQVGEPVM